MIFADLHCDTAVNIMEAKKDLYKSDQCVSIEKLLSFENFIQIFAIFMDEKYLKAPMKTTLEAIEYFNLQVKKYEKYIALANNYKDIENNMKDKKISAIFSIEGGEALEGDIDNLYKFYALGVRAITLTWSRRNQLGDGVFLPDPKGLTAFGKQVVMEMDKMGMMVDVSHLSEEGFWNVYDICTGPFIASHSNCYSLCQNKRNLNDRQLKAIGERRGIMGINLYPPFLTDKPTATLTDIMKHIDYALNMAGEDSVGLGGDFDGVESLPIGFDDVRSYKTLGEELAKVYGQELAEKICYKNFLRVFKEIAR